MGHFGLAPYSYQKAQNFTSPFATINNGSSPPASSSKYQKSSRGWVDTRRSNHAPRWWWLSMLGGVLLPPGQIRERHEARTDIGRREVGHCERDCATALVCRCGILVFVQLGSSPPSALHNAHNRTCHSNLTFRGRMLHLGSLPQTRAFASLEFELGGSSPGRAGAPPQGAFSKMAASSVR